MPKSGKSRISLIAGHNSDRTPARFSIDEYDPLLEIFDQIERSVEADIRVGMDMRPGDICMSTDGRKRQLEVDTRPAPIAVDQKCQARGSTTSRLRRRRFSA
jgi:hypothetical protein